MKGFLFAYIYEILTFMSASNFSITSTIKKYPKHPYQKIKEAVLGKSYNLSLAFIGPDRAKKINQQYRNKTYSPNVLSFPLEKNYGEIFICPVVANKEASDFNLTKEGYIAFLFIHGLLHLKGYDHGDKMESLERRYMNQFSIT